MKRLAILFAFLGLIASPAYADPNGAATPPGTAGTQSSASGCIYESSPAAASNGQQRTVHCDPYGNAQSTAAYGSPPTVVGPTSPLPVSDVAMIASAQTVTASSAYASGNAVGGLMTITGASRYVGSGGLVQSVIVNSKSGQTTQIDIVLFRDNPSGSTCTDKTAFSVAAADFDKVIGVAHVTDWTSLGTPSVGQAQQLALPFSASTQTALYACAVTRSTPTYTSTSDISIAFRILQN